MYLYSQFIQLHLSFLNSCLLCIYFISLLIHSCILYINFTSFHTIDITHYYIANNNRMANLQCYTNEHVENYSYKWKLKRPNNTIEMLNHNDSIYQIMNVGFSDEGSYSCTFDINSNQRVTGDNTLCLITLGI